MSTNRDDTNDQMDKLISENPELHYYINDQISRLISEDPEVHSRALASFKKMGIEPLAELLIALRKAKNNLEEMKINAALAVTGIPSGVGHIARIAGGKDADIREFAVETLARIGDTLAIEPLIQIIRSGPRNIRKKAKTALEKILYTAPPGNSYLLCGRCFLRYKDFKAKRSLFHSVTYCTCPNCRSNTFPWAGIEKVVLVLDRGFGDRRSKRNQNGTLQVNWLTVKTPCDYNEIHIEDADDFEVEELVIKLKNDMDKTRRERMKEILVYLSPRLKLSAAKVNLLRDNFKFTQILPDP